ncbi:MAG: DUF898 family protein [Treponema sp.]
MEIKSGYKIEKFNTSFGTDGWLGLYMAAMVVNIFVNILQIPLSYLIGDALMAGVIKALFSVLQLFVMLFFMVAAYSKAILVFINTLSLDTKKFSTNLDYNSLFSVMLANTFLIVFTLGLYLPWAYKAIIDKIVNNVEYQGSKCFKFNSLPFPLFAFILISFVIIFVLIFVMAFSFIIVLGFGGIINLMFFPITIILFLSFISVICAMQVFMINWIINIKIASAEKNATYTLNINISSAVLFYLGQVMLLLVTFGFYIGAYMINIYEYFVSRIVEKTDENITGHFRFAKPANKGAGFILGQVILTTLTAGFYYPFALVEYSRFFVNNTYLDLIETKEVESDTILINP